MKKLLILACMMFLFFLARPYIIEAQKRKATVPTESSVNTFLRNQVTEQSGGALSLTGFRKTNGYEERLTGMYVIEWQAEILFEQNGYKVGDVFVGYWQDFRLSARPGDDFMGRKPIHFDKGTTIRLTGIAMLRNTEKGWRLEGLSVKTSDLKPDIADVYANRGRDYYDKGNYDQAIKDFNKAIELKPDYAVVYVNRGHAHTNKGN